MFHSANPIPQGVFLKVIDVAHTEGLQTPTGSEQIEANVSWRFFYERGLSKGLAHSVLDGTDSHLPGALAERMKAFHAKTELQIQMLYPAYRKILEPGIDLTKTDLK